MAGNNVWMHTHCSAMRMRETKCECHLSTFFSSLLEFQALQKHVEIQEHEHLFRLLYMTTVTTQWPNVCIIQLKVINHRGLCNNLFSIISP